MTEPWGHSRPGAVGGIAYAMTHTINAEDVEAEIPPELEFAEPLTAHPRLDGEDREAA